MEDQLAVRVKETCRHGHRPSRATARRAPLGNDVRWQLRVHYDCDRGCFESGVFEDRPRRVVFGDDGEILLDEI